MTNIQIDILRFKNLLGQLFHAQKLKKRCLKTTPCKQNFQNKLRSFSDNEDGIATVWAIFWLILCLGISGLSVDISNAYKVHQILQTTADVSAHAGALELGEDGSPAVLVAVKRAANQYAALNMRPDRYGDVLLDSDILVGNWNRATSSFEEMLQDSAVIPNAVRVTTRQSGGASSRVGTFFLRFVGFDSFGFDTSSTVERYMSQCEGDGIFANGDNNFSTQQQFLNNYCIHGEKGITFAQHNYFEAGTIASTPDLDNCGPSKTSCTDAHNPGIEAALRAASYSNGKVARIDEYLTELQNQYSSYQPSYIDSTKPAIVTNSSNFDASTLLPGQVYVVNCNSGGSLNLGAASGSSSNGNGNGKGKGNSNGNGGGSTSTDPILKSQFVLVGIGCNLVFDESIQYEDAIFATSATGNQTISGSSGVVLGRNDGCTQGGEVVAITAGSVHFAAKLEAYDVEFIIKDDLHLASKANAKSVHSGSSFNVGGDVRITTKHTFSGCGGSTTPTFDPKYSWRITQ